MDDIELVSPSPEQEASSSCSPVRIVLPNIQGFKYTIGTMYPGRKENEEFIFYRYKYIVDSIHCYITVDEDGGYWVQNASESSTVYINEDLITGKPVPLVVGDVLALGFPHPFVYNSNLKCFPVFLVKKREVKDPPIIKTEEIESEEESEICTNFFLDDNSLIFGKILSKLSYNDLKHCRLVCKKWNEEATKIMGRRGQISITFVSDYLLPQNSSKVFQYLHEVKEVKLQKLSIEIGPTLSPNNIREMSKKDEKKFGFQNPIRTAQGEPGEKVIHDLQSLFTSNHKFTSLSLTNKLEKGTVDFTFFKTILQALGENLVELRVDHSLGYLPKTLAKFPLKSLKKFEHHATEISEKYKKPIKFQTNADILYTQWISNFVESFHTKLESFSCDNFMSVLYFQQFMKFGIPNLREVKLRYVDFSTVSLLLKLKNPLTRLLFEDLPKMKTQTDVNVIQKLLDKFAKRLEHFQIFLLSELNAELVFPSFPELKTLSIHFTTNVKISWGKDDEDLQYSKYLPKLRSLEIIPFSTKSFSNNINQWVELTHFPEGWENEGNAFHSFFPSESEEVFLPLNNLLIRVFNQETTNKAVHCQFCVRLQKIVNMFPNVNTPVVRYFRENLSEFDYTDVEDEEDSEGNAD